MLTFEKLSREPEAFEELAGMDVAGFEDLFGRFACAQEERRGLIRTTKRATRPGDRSPPQRPPSLSVDDLMYLMYVDPKEAPLDPRYQDIVLRHGEPRHWYDQELRERFDVYIDRAEPWSPRPERVRGPGAGHPPKLDERTRLLIALVWVRMYPTYELLGRLCDLSKSNARSNVEDVLATLDTLPGYRVVRPDQVTGRRRFSSGYAIRKSFPRAPRWIDELADHGERGQPGP